VIREINRVSKPGRRCVIRRSRTCRASITGSEFSILSTPRGVMSDNEARAANVGGEVLVRVYEDRTMSRVGKSRLPSRPRHHPDQRSQAVGEGQRAICIWSERPGERQARGDKVVFQPANDSSRRA